MDPPDPWSLVRGSCGVIYGLRFLEFFSHPYILINQSHTKNLYPRGGVSQKFRSWNLFSP